MKERWHVETGWIITAMTNWNPVSVENNSLHWDLLCLNHSFHFILQTQCIWLLYSSKPSKISLDKILKMAPVNQSATQIWQNPNDVDSIVLSMLLFLAPLLGLPWTCSNIVQTDFDFCLDLKMSKIGTLQNFLEDLFQECTIQFVNKKHSIQLQYKVEKKSQILVVTWIFRHNPEKALLKSAMYVRDEEDVDFLRAYLSGLVLTIRVEYV